jgi:hypothetical protein
MLFAIFRELGIGKTLLRMLFPLQILLLLFSTQLISISEHASLQLARDIIPCSEVFNIDNQFTKPASIPLLSICQFFVI